MKPTHTVWLLGLLLAGDCQPNERGKRPAGERKTIRVVEQTFHPDTASITRSFQTWYTYTHQSICLGRPFIGLNTNSVAIDKDVLLGDLMTGRVIPVKIKAIDEVPVYRLVPLNPRHADIASAIQEIARNELGNAKLEGTTLPDYAFRDLLGNRYTQQTTRGHYLLLQCWYIGCAACVNEFPRLNQLVENWRGRNDLLFLSLAPDTGPALVSFLQRKPLRYAMIPGAKNYLERKLGMTRYPTHIVVDRQGTIIKVVNDVDDLRIFLTANLLPTVH